MRAKPDGELLSITMGDFAEVPVDGMYTLIYVVFNTLFNLLTKEEQVRPRLGRGVHNAVVTSRREPGKSGRRWLGLGVGAALIGAAMAKELRRPRGERTWHGKIAGTVPYDLRRPTLARVCERVWNAADRRILVPTVFGVGWTVNAGRLVELFRSTASRG